jgi:hypothetical protein
MPSLLSDPSDLAMNMDLVVAYRDLWARQRSRRTWRGVGPLVILCFTLPSIVLAAGQTASQSARDIPLAYDVDVVVVGGASAGVAAAVAAAEQGAKVFLAAPRPYLGEDLCATYRLWLEADEVPDDPLATELFTLPQSLEGIRYTYQADQPSAGKHEDTQPPGMLADGKWGTAFTESVQYNDDVTISIDFGTRQEIRKLHVMFFQGPRAYEVHDVPGQRRWPKMDTADRDR